MLQNTLTDNTEQDKLILELEQFIFDLNDSLAIRKFVINESNTDLMILVLHYYKSSPEYIVCSELLSIA